MQMAHNIIVGAHVWYKLVQGNTATHFPLELLGDIFRSLMRPGTHNHPIDHIEWARKIVVRENPKEWLDILWRVREGTILSLNTDEFRHVLSSCLESDADTANLQEWIIQQTTQIMKEKEEEKQRKLASRQAKPTATVINPQQTWTPSATTHEKKPLPKKDGAKGKWSEPYEKPNKPYTYSSSKQSITAVPFKLPAALLKNR